MCTLFCVHPVLCTVCTLFCVLCVPCSVCFVYASFAILCTLWTFVVQTWSSRAWSWWPFALQCSMVTDRLWHLSGRTGWSPTQGPRRYTDKERVFGKLRVSLRSLIWCNLFKLQLMSCCFFQWKYRIEAHFFTATVGGCFGKAIAMVTSSLSS